MLPDLNCKSFHLMENGKKSFKFSLQGRRKVFFAVFLLLFPLFSFAQFYTGSEQSFGRKRVQYDRFIWMYYRFDGFDVYFTNQGKNLALYTANYVQNHLHEMEEKTGVQASPGLRFIVFNRLTDLKQSNIGYVDEENESNANTGGITHFLGNKVFLYFEGDYLDFERQIRRGMAEMLVSQAINGSKVGAQYRNSYVMDLPHWFVAGLASYLGRGWDEELDERMAATVRQKDFKYFWGLEGEEADFAGHSFWYFIEQTYGAEAITRCIRVVAREKRLNKTFNVAFNASFKEVMNRWRDFYLKLYSGIQHEDSTQSVMLPRTGKIDEVYQHFVLNANGEEAAFVSNRLGRSKVYLQSTEPMRRFCIYRSGAAINDNPDYSFPLLCFHPNGDMLGIMTEEKGRTTLIVYNIERNKKGLFKPKAVRRNTMRYYLDMFDKVNSFSFSPDGRTIALGATNDGYPDIYLFRLGAGTRQRITFDLYDDYDPVFVPGTDLLVFSSNRPGDSIKKNEKFEVAPSFPNGTNLFAYNLKEGGNRLIALTEENAGTLLRLPQVLENGQIAFTSNLYGQTNIALGQLGKTISHIDTAIHYRTTFQSGIVTDFEPGLEYIDISQKRGQYARLQRKPNRHGFYTLTEGNTDNLLPLEPGRKAERAKPSRFKAQLWERERKKAAKIAYQDSLRRAAEAQNDSAAMRLLQARHEKRVFSLRNAEPSDNPLLTAYDLWLLQRAGLLLPDSGSGQGSDSTQFLRLLPADSALLTYNPALAQAQETYRKAIGVSSDETWIPLSDSAAMAALMASMADDTSSAFPKIPPKQHMYEVEFSVNSSTAQLGFSYLNACYQAFTNSQTPLYLNAAASGFTQISIADLMENHRLIGGFAFSLDFSSTEYLFSYEYLERRLGHQVVLHMSNLNDNTYYPYKQNTYDGYYIMKYPLSPVSSLRGTVFGRYDRTIYQAIDYQSLVAKTMREMRVGLKAEWVYDHSRFITQNIYFGTRGKVWLEYYQGVLNNNQNLFVFGLDFRDYRRLYKNLIWANRIAFSTSFGQQKLVYYMGGVDGWVGAKFNRDVETDPNQNYAYQTLATNMRGFHQNIRNGNTFAVINSEIRFPFVQVLSPRPVQSAFLRHLQLVFFGDIGSAWSGWNPWSKDNLFYKKTIQDGKLTVVLNKDANPIVGGFGLGLRLQVLGYFLRGDLAWGVENGIVHKKPVFYFSLSTDF